MNECSALLLLASYLLNTTFRRLRGSPIYLMFCHLSVINLFDLSFSVLLSLLFVANGKWTFGEEWCRVNATVQEFSQIYTLLTLILMSVERAVGLAIDTPPTPDTVKEYVIVIPSPITIFSVFSIFHGFASLVIASPSATSLVPVKAFRNRYVCATGSGAPLGYILTRLALYIACLCVLLVCISLIFKKRGEHSLPQHFHEYSDFICKTCAMQEHLSRAKLVTLLVSVFILVEGPYLSICFSYEVRFSLNMPDIPQDADTLVTSLKFLFPLLSPICILFWCSDISVYIKKLFSCRTYDPPCVNGQSTNRCKGELEIFSLVALQQLHTMCKVEADFDFSDFLSKKSIVRFTLPGELPITSSPS
uniref:G_PROTEIN_RECEP_F1_2 domain-containing protein n=1 Tax=Angiostrongylus cantonensis TaxID=6313 RepID=A0A0K0D326_ANGCA